MAIHIQLFNNIYKSTPILLSCETKIPGNIFFPKAVAIVRVLNAPERPMCGRFGLQMRQYWEVVEPLGDGASWGR